MNHVTCEENLVPEMNFLIVDISNTVVQMHILFTEIRELTKFAKESNDNSDLIQLLQNTFNPHTFVNTYLLTYLLQGAQ